MAFRSSLRRQKTKTRYAQKHWVDYSPGQQTVYEFKYIKAKKKPNMVLPSFEEACSAMNVDPQPTQNRIENGRS